MEWDLRHGFASPTHSVKHDRTVPIGAKNRPPSATILDLKKARSSCEGHGDRAAKVARSSHVRGACSSTADIVARERMLRGVVFTRSCGEKGQNEGMKFRHDKDLPLVREQGLQDRCSVYARIHATNTAARGDDSASTRSVSTAA